MTWLFTSPRRRWTILFLVLWALFVWPTPWRYESTGSHIVRINRFTQSYQFVTDRGLSVERR